MQIRDLTTIEQCHDVVQLQRDVWKFDDEDLVPAAVLILTVKLGGILTGAFTGADGATGGMGGEMVGFVYSLPGIREGRVLQWSHMLGVVDAYRRTGIGRGLKLAQRDRTLAMGLDLIEWTFDPLQAANATLNLRRLGATVSVYLENIYGTSSSALHRGTPTDRFVADWWVRSSRVVQRLEGDPPVADRAPARIVNDVREEAGWLVCGALELDAREPALSVVIPRNFNAMQRDAPALALEWRLKTRDLFQACFARGYTIVDFTPGEDRGAYRLTIGESASHTPPS